MYELYILGQLLFTDRSAYKLRFVLENILGAHRKVSFGVLYPLLDKMKAAGTIVMTDDLDWRGKKKIHVTSAGRARFDELMKAPVQQNAHLDDVYLFKLSGLELVDEQLAHQIIDDFRSEKLAQRDGYKEHLTDLESRHAGASFLPSARRLNQLQIDLANTYLEYVDKIESELE